MTKLDKLKTDLLNDVAGWFGVEGLPEADNNADRVALLLADGVTDDLYQEERKLRNLDEKHQPIVEDDEDEAPSRSAQEDPDDDDEPVKEESVILIKMERKNHSFEHKGAKLYRFTKDHPYQLVNADDEQALINMGGFRTATQNEVKDFYA